MVNASSALLSHHHRALEENTKLDSEEITAEDIPQEEVDALFIDNEALINFKKRKVETIPKAPGKEKKPKKGE